MNPVIFDTGPLVAWFCPRDEHHAWVRQAFAQIPAGGFICEAVLAEVCHLVAKEGVARGKVIEFVERARLTVVSLGGELPVVRALLECYADAPMDFVDACWCACRNCIRKPGYARLTDILSSSGVRVRQ